MTHILEALKENVRLFEQKKDSFSDVVPDLEKIYQKTSNKTVKQIGVKNKNRLQPSKKVNNNNQKSLKKPSVVEKNVAQKNTTNKLNARITNRNSSTTNKTGITVSKRNINGSHRSTSDSKTNNSNRPTLINRSR